MTKRGLGVDMEMDLGKGTCLVLLRQYSAVHNSHVTRLMRRSEHRLEVMRLNGMLPRLVMDPARLPK